MRIQVKNMVCRRCVMSVEDVLQKLGIDGNVTLGEIETSRELSADEMESLNREFRQLGFEIVETRTEKIISGIKQAVLEYVSGGESVRKETLSKFITAKIPYDYSYLSDLFSSVEGYSIEQYFIRQRIEKVKELIVYDQLSLTEIAYATGFSSVHHLSAQFKKVTGLTPSHFRTIGAQKRKSLDAL